MERYVTESLATEIIRPSLSMWPCIHYWGLDPQGGLPPILPGGVPPTPPGCSYQSSPQGPLFFNKLDLENAYHLVQFRHRNAWKTALNTSLGHAIWLN